MRRRRPTCSPNCPSRAPIRLRPSRPADIPWLQLFIGIWFVVVSVHGALLIVAQRRVSFLVRRGSRLSADQEDDVQQLARRIGLRRPPLVLVSDGITSPQAVGLWRRRILLPVAFAERITPAEWQMALCHELMHLRRRDLVFGWVPAIAERLFFFHPLARFASEQYLLEREAACDAAVLHALDVDAHDYGRLLLRLGVSRAMPGFAVSGSSPTLSLLRRRLEMLQHVTATAGTSRAHWLVAAAAFVLVPFHLAARTPESLPTGAPDRGRDGGSDCRRDRPTSPSGPPNRTVTRDNGSSRAKSASADAQGRCVARAAARCRAASVATARGAA
jgi:beta-lactamase regulating signal transducer with metallopeptidase domain